MTEAFMLFMLFKAKWQEHMPEVEFQFQYSDWLESYHEGEKA